ncbi:MAG: hypothetical protein Greene101449_646 [Candidatus Peregrinibacteria bacterium Greene1014_49]|nr:MAG: hypothetical protein Greene101449_646 [Candidatus Peregrinibacteria bacterium Greene1014_49]
MVACAATIIRIAKVFTTGCVRDSNTECPLANSILLTSNIIFAFIGLVTNCQHALAIRAYVVVAVIIPASKNWIAGVDTRIKEGDAGGVIFGTFGVLTAIDEGGTFVGTRSVDGDALVLGIAFHVLLATAEDGITFILCVSRKNNASGVIGSAFGVFTAIDDGGAFIGTGCVHRDALIAGIAFRVLLATTKNGITFVLCVSRKDDAGCVVFGAFGVLSTINDGGAFICARSIHGDALVCTITFRVLLATTKNGITFVLCVSRKNNASGVIGSAFGVFTARNHRGTFVSTRALCSDTLIPIITDKMFFDVAAVRIRLAIIGTGAGNSDAEICTACCVFTQTAAEYRITAIYSGDGKKYACRPDTFGVLPAGNRWSTQNRTRTGENDATIGCITYCMRLRSTTQCNTASIGARPRDMNAQKTAACKMLFFLTITTKEWVASICSFSGNNHARALCTFRMLVAIDGGGAFIGARNIHGDALPSGIAFGVLLAATENGVATICAGAGQHDTR